MCSAQAPRLTQGATVEAGDEGVPLQVDVVARRCAPGFPLEPPRREAVKEFDIFAFGNRPKPRVAARRPSFHSRMHQSPLHPDASPSRGRRRPDGGTIETALPIAATLPGHSERGGVKSHGAFAATADGADTR